MWPKLNQSLDSQTYTAPLHLFIAVIDQVLALFSLLSKGFLQVYCIHSSSCLDQELYVMWFCSTDISRLDFLLLCMVPSFPGSWLSYIYCFMANFELRVRNHRVMLDFRRVQALQVGRHELFHIQWHDDGFAWHASHHNGQLVNCSIMKMNVHY